MRPYLAILRDSFHAALSSRILWVAFVAIWLLLAALAPIGYKEDFTTIFRSHDFHNGTRMKAMLASGLLSDESKATPIGRIAAAMPEDLVRQLERVSKGDEVRIRLRALADGLNELLDNESWYDQEAWKTSLRLRELRDLDEKEDDELSDSLRRRRARLRIEAAMPGVFETRSARAISVTYAGYDFPATINVDKPQFANMVNQFVMPFIVDWLLGFILVMLGILVTASIVPDMLQPGSLHLLLSKPVSRTMLLLSKFVGGCAFVLLCVIQLIVGLYLIAGLRLDIWNIRLLWCIPVSVFLFSVYYSVSVLAGLRWRSSILAVGVTVIFGTISFVVGAVGGFFDGFVSRPAEIQRLAIAGDTVFAATRGAGLQRFDPDQNVWVEIFESNAMGPDRVLPPIAISDEVIVTARARNARFNPYGSGALDLLVLSKSSDWAAEPSLRLPTATSRLYRAGENGVMAMNTGELAITDRKSILAAAGEADESGDDAEESKEPQGLFDKLANMIGGATAGFTEVLPSRMAITPPRGVVVSQDGQWLIALSRGRIVRLKRPAEAGAWELEKEHLLEGESSRRCVIALSDGVVLVARNEEPVRLFDATTLEPIAEYALPDTVSPVVAAGIGGGRFGLVTSDGRCRVYEHTSGDQMKEELIATKEVQAIHLHRSTNDFYVVHHVDQIDVLNPTTLDAKVQIRPSLTSWRLVDRYLISPLRMVIPQTGELGQTIASMVSGKSAVSFGGAADDEELVRYNFFRPLISCSLFIFVMMTLSCVYFATRDF
ncbi:MAG: ABC transporter permease subunit [Rubripirellula sp.]